MNLGVGEIALLLVLALVLFGAKRLPQAGRAAGEAIREFKAAFYGQSRLKNEDGPSCGGGEAGGADKGADHQGTGPGDN
jgi:sec-independent protein translocase protein TatA